MKRILTYLLPGLVLLLGACSKDSADPGQSGRSGVLKMEISATRTAGDGEYNPLEHLTVRIYNSEGGLLRKYTSEGHIPARLSLLAGDYRVTVEAGKSEEASFTERLYKGEETFTVRAGETTPVEVVCKLQNTVVEVKFAESVTANFDPDFYTRVALCAPYDNDAVLEGRVKSLKYTADAKGYFTLPEGATDMSWHFEGTHTERGPVVQEGTISDLKVGGRYSLTFKFSPDLPGYIAALLIEVDPSTDDQDDTIIFSPDPTIAGDGFDLAQLQRYTGGERTFNIATMAAMQHVTLTVDGTAYTLFDAANPDVPAVDGIRTEAPDKQNLSVTLSDALFDGFMAGDHKLSFHITDKDNGELTSETTFRLQGLLPVTAANYDLWHNTLTMETISFDETSGTQFTLTGNDGSSQQIAGTPNGNDRYTATFAPEWEESVNPNGKTVYSAKTGTGIRPGRTYEYTVTFSGMQIEGSFSTPGPNDPDENTAKKFAIPDGDMQNESLPCFTESGSATSDFWGSGNNNNAKSLCKPATSGSNQYANLQSTAAGMLSWYSLAAGNLFTGTFSMKSMTGTVGFGQKYTYAARPTALRVKYHAKVGTVDYNLANGPLSKGSQDKARIFAAVVDWGSRHNVASTFNMTGSSSCSGSWDPENGADAVSEGKIIGYASMWINTNTEGETLVSSGDALQFYWYDTAADAPTGNYTLIISSSANAYGDLFNGCSTNHLWVDDFEWVY